MWARGIKTSRGDKCSHHQTFPQWTSGLSWAGEGQPPSVYHGLPSDTGPLWVHSLGAVGLLCQNRYVWLNRSFIFVHAWNRVCNQDHTSCVSLVQSLHCLSLQVSTSTTKSPSGSQSPASWSQSASSSAPSCTRSKRSPRPWSALTSSSSTCSRPSSSTTATSCPQGRSSKTSARCCGTPWWGRCGTASASAFLCSPSASLRCLEFKTSTCRSVNATGRTECCVLWGIKGVKGESEVKGHWCTGCDLDILFWAQNNGNTSMHKG